MTKIGSSSCYDLVYIYLSQKSHIKVHSPKIIESALEMTNKDLIKSPQTAKMFSRINDQGPWVQGSSFLAAAVPESPWMGSYAIISFKKKKETQYVIKQNLWSILNDVSSVCHVHLML